MRRLAALVISVVLLALTSSDAAATTAYSQNAYRLAAFSTQATDYYCTAAVAQNIVNLALGRSSHSASEQATFYAYGRARNRYAYAARGVDPQGVAAILNHYSGRTTWHWAKSSSLQGALKIAAQRMRATGLPAVLFVGAGSHVWTMNGYTASADPATTSSFTVSYVRFSGPLYPRQVAYHGWYDLAPDTRASVSAFAVPFRKYSEYASFRDARWTPWNGYWVVVVP